MYHWPGPSGSCSSVGSVGSVFWKIMGLNPSDTLYLSHCGLIALMLALTAYHIVHSILFFFPLWSYSSDCGTHSKPHCSFNTNYSLAKQFRLCSTGKHTRNHATGCWLKNNPCQFVKPLGSRHFLLWLYCNHWHCGHLHALPPLMSAYNLYVSGLI